MRNHGQIPISRGHWSLWEKINPQTLTARAPCRALSSLLSHGGLPETGTMQSSPEWTEQREDGQGGEPSVSTLTGMNCWNVSAKRERFGKEAGHTWSIAELISSIVDSTARRLGLDPIKIIINPRWGNKADSGTRERRKENYRPTPQGRSF